MRHAIGLLFAFVVCPPMVASAAAPKPVAVTIDTTLPTASGHIRQFTFDGDADTYFASGQNAGRADHFTLIFDKPVAVRSVAITTGRPEGGDALDAGSLEASSDAKTFVPLANFKAGVARAQLDGRRVQAVRVRPASDLAHPLVIREFAVISDPPLAIFRYPVEFVVQADDEPEMKAWAEKAARVCEQEYPMICDELRSDGFKPPHVVTLTLKSDYRGVAGTSGQHIIGSVRYFRQHPEDIGAMVHETAHVVQAYQVRGNPSWLVEGIADYVRFYKYEPGRSRPPRPEQARYDGSYRVTAAFLAYLRSKYDKDLVRKLNEAMRRGQYREDLFKDLTGKPVEQLGEEWRASLRRRRG
jgi:hypothetical protein